MNASPSPTLWWSPVSPYVRIVDIAAHELGVSDRFDRREVTPANIIDLVSPDNPLAMIPTLVTGDGAAIFDSRTIVYWLDDTFGNQSLIPREPAAHAAVMSRYALATGVIDAANLRRNLSLQPEETQPQGFLNRLQQRIGRALDRLDTICGDDGQAFTADQIATAVALGYLDFRFAEDDWRADRPALAAWHEAVRQRPSLVATDPSAA